MLNAVWVAVIAAACCFMILAVVSVYVLLKLAGLITQTATAVSGLRERSDQAIDRANAAIDTAAGQLTRTDAITASMDEVTANMAELTGRVTALAPLGRLAAASAGGWLGRAAALLYGVRHAAELRTAAKAGRAEGVFPPNQPSRAVPGGLSPRGEMAGGSGGRPPGPAPALESGRRTERQR